MDDAHRNPQRPAVARLGKTLAWVLAGSAVAIAAAAAVLLYRPDSAPPDDKFNYEREKRMANSPDLKKATFGGGCFWCTEAVFQQMKGVEAVISGYAGGHVENPTYEQVCAKNTGHAEVVQISYDPEAVTYEELLEVFWKTHDPTTPNRQGADVGPQYRSIVLAHDDEQQKTAQHYKQKLNESGAFDAPIVTEIEPLTTFCPAEDDHQNYYARNPNQGYCAFVVRPKVDKFREVFAEKLRK